MCRHYRALSEIWQKTEADDTVGVARWVRLGGKIVEQMDESIAEVEAYTGAADLRLVLDDLKRMREAKEKVEKE
jgi:hypothetical protein